MNRPTMILAIWNVVVFLIYGLDKILSKFSKQRISERFLIIIALAFGSLGAVFGMTAFRHKTLKPKFRLLIPLAFIIQALLILYYLRKTSF